MTIIALTFTLTANSSILTTDYFQPLELDQDYEAALIDMQTYNSIPNVEKRNNFFHIGERTIELPVGSFEIDDIVKYITKKLESLDPTIDFSMRANKNTLKCELRSGKVVKDGKTIKNGQPIYFDRKRSIGPLFRF